MAFATVTVVIGLSLSRPHLGPTRIGRSTAVSEQENPPTATTERRHGRYLKLRFTPSTASLRSRAAPSGQRSRSPAELSLARLIWG